MKESIQVTLEQLRETLHYHAVRYYVETTE